MSPTVISRASLALCLGFLIIACEKDSFPQEIASLEPQKDVSFRKNRNTTSTGRQIFSENPKENLHRSITLDVAPSECGATDLQAVQWKYFNELAGDEIAATLFELYTNLNRVAVRKGIGTDYFGENGEHTRLVLKTVKDLERFWNMKDQVNVLGQHNSTLDDREIMAQLLLPLIADIDSEEYLYEQVDRYLELNALSPTLPENPFFAGDAYASLDNKIVLGDGAMKLFIETGLEPEIVWTSILTHEWSHQIQIDHMRSWYPPGTFESDAEETRHIELEADFFSGYYLTHKRGATYNWKRINDFLNVFFQAGDCSFEFEKHHGTPQQRMSAARAGYELANQAQRKGQILSPEEVHDYFMAVIIPIIV